MEKIGISKLVEFGRLEKHGPKLTFIKKLLNPKLGNFGNGGGDYWISCTSSCAAAFWSQDITYLSNKIEDLREKILTTPHKITKNQFQKNIDLLISMLDFDFEIISPKVNMKRESLKFNTFEYEGLSVQVRPQHIYSYEIDGVLKIAGVWFVAKNGGYSHGELGIFSSALYLYLSKRFSDKFVVDPVYCVAIDVARMNKVNFKEVLKGQIPDLLNETVNSIKTLLK